MFLIGDCAKIRPCSCYIYLSERFLSDRLSQQTDRKKKCIKWKVSTAQCFLQTLPEILHLWFWKVPFFPHDWEMIYFCTLSFKCQFSVFLYLAKSFFCWAQKKLNAHVSFFFSTMHTLLKSLLGKFDPKLGIWHQAFPAIKLWVNGSSLNCTHWELFSPDRTTVCLHTAVSSQRLSKSVAGHSVHLSTNYLFTCQSFLFSVLFNKHSSNELNGRLTNQYWSQQCSTQVVKGQMLPKHRREFF